MSYYYKIEGFANSLELHNLVNFLDDKGFFPALYTVKTLIVPTKRGEELEKFVKKFKTSLKVYKFKEYKALIPA